MSFTVVTLGSQIANEGVALLRDAGASLVATEAFPSKDEMIAVLDRHRPDAVMVRLVPRLDEDVMRAAPTLKVIAKHGVGCDDIDVAAARRLGIPVMIATGCNAQSVAEHALAMMLALVKDLERQTALMRSGRFDKSLYRGRELRGMRLGLVGLGQIGRSFAAMAAAIGMVIEAYDPFAPDAAFVPPIARATDLDALLARADVVSLHCPLTETTRGLLGAREIGLIRPGAWLINTARGEVIDEAALAAALRSGAIAGAGIDSFAAEPPPADHPFLHLPNVIATPHVAGVTDDAKREVSLQTARNVLSVISGGAPDPRYLAR
ncbi:hydroxyacid dehydrogenase [Rhodoplanes sp. TEM]|uniref:Hydroxyacid dehydrogenase n=1 Tax=Rhodoplanes tepidamans TaxID=200616 RepID=A0ABT5J5W4_RHOTP|nr:MULTISPECIES: hydroxyacid dehydrogenase [Rhodoplanes]MDC7785034.1 hydroxyacid dehydrogenase [Rhodoplanes tepidamans]MDC7982508.1 hydroxyacid dehydrogenase [Rhodoplanes sp. TEM]MDQ0356522.1 D-3-phosphoglycerate dehydrogenase [Rhodoplanes tepidamans]